MQERYAYYPGCLASLSQKELDSSTRAVCAKLGVELVELESMTCCGAGDIHEAKPDYYLHLNARILGQAEALGIPTILTICNVCTLNLRQANKKLQQDTAELERINRNLAEVGAATYSGGVDVRHLLWEVSRGRRLRALQGDRRALARGPQGRALLRLPDPAPLQAARLRGRPRSTRRSLERLIEACGAEAIDYEAKIKCCGFPIVLAREDVALGAAVQPLAQAARCGRRRDRDAVPALPPLARRLAAEGREAGGPRAQRPDPAPRAAARRRRRAFARTS